MMRGCICYSALLFFIPSARALSANVPVSFSFPQQDRNASSENVWDVLIIGGGLVGCAVARAATMAGYSCAIVEKEPHVMHWASGSNSGIACTGVDANPGTLERALIRDSIAQLPAFLQEMNIPHDACGSLVCRWPWDDGQEKRRYNNDNDSQQVQGLANVLCESHKAGDTHATRLSRQQVLEMEPNLNPCVQEAVHIPGEIVVDPWLYSIALLVQARHYGCTLYTGTSVDPCQMNWDGLQWSVPVTTTAATETENPSSPPSTMYARTIVCATGAWAVDWEAALQQKFYGINMTNDLQAAPRRGQYRIYQVRGSSKLRHPIQPIPTQRTKGVFVFASLYNQIIVGPTALDQESKTDRSLDTLVAQELDHHVQRILPQVDVKSDLVGEYVGIRPGTNQRDYQIRTHFSPPWITVAGIRSTGLTASLGIGRHVTHLLQQILRERGVVPCPVEHQVAPPIALPPLSDLKSNFQKRGDGCVEIQGHVYKVTHPITYLGWKYQETL